MAGGKQWISFDPTIHAGHVITAVTIVFCALGQYYGIKGDISDLQRDSKQHEQQIAEIKTTAATDRQEFAKRIDDMSKDQKQEVSKLRDDMNGWFMALDQKLDRKADKK